MKLNILVTAAGILPSLARCDYPTWQAPGADDVRAPCPMLNSLANHGFLPHNGKNITLDDLVKGLSDGVNMDPGLAAFLFDFALTTNPEPNATVFSLDNLSRHNILEHDASLSRADAFYGDPQVFNQTVFDETKSYWTGDVIDLDMAAASRHARVITSAITNPEFAFSELGAQFSYGETGAYLMFLGDKVAATASKAWVEYFFENERLPYSLGWSKPKDPITEDDLFDILSRVINATGTTPEKAAEMMKRGGIHGGVLPVVA